MTLKNNQTVEKAINFLLNILIFIFSIFLLVSIYTGFQTRIIGNDYANFFGYSLFEVQTGSMEGSIDAGDWIVVKLTPKVELNDIVTYELNGEYITHRIIEVYNGTYITQGDANNAKDAPVDQSQIIGKVVKVLSGFGIIRKTLFNPAVLLTLIITLFAFNSAFKNNKISFNGNKINFNNLINSFLSTLENLIEKLKERLNGQTIPSDYSGFWDETKSYNIGQDNSFYDTKEYEKLEEELSKTALYRIVSVDNEEVNEDFKILTPKNKTKEEIEEELGKTSLYRIVSVDTSDVGEKYKDVGVKVEKQNQTQTSPKVEKYAELEDELGKTSIFRVISVDADEVNKKEITTEDVDNKPVEDLEKTSHYRFISVAPDEIDNTLLEVAENEMKNPKPKELPQEKVAEPEPEEIPVEEVEGLTSINLDLLKSKNSRKGKNIIDKILIIKKEEINELIDIIVKDDSTYVYRAMVKNKLTTTYTDAKYYDYYGTVEIESRGRNLISKVKKIVSVIAEKLIKDYKGKDTKYGNIVESYVKIFTLIANLEQARDSVSDAKAKREFYKKELTKYYKDWDNQRIENLIEEIMKVQKRYSDTIEFFLKKLETNTFDLKLNKIAGVKNMFGLELDHNISFSKVYSDYIVDKTYSEGIVAEDKISVLLTLLSVRLVNDMLTADFGKKYVFYIPSSLYSKVRKFASLLRIIDNEYAKVNVIILVTYEMLIKNKQIIKEYRKKGYRFGLVFDKDDKLLKKDRPNLYIVNCIFINKRDADMATILSSIPEDLSGKIISENIVEKVGDVGGE